jgi:hypothetical protein
MRDTSPELTSKSLRYGYWSLILGAVILAAYLSTCVDRKPASSPPAQTRLSPPCAPESASAGAAQRGVPGTRA